METHTGCDSGSDTEGGQALNAGGRRAGIDMCGDTPGTSGWCYGCDRLDGFVSGPICRAVAVCGEFVAPLERYR